MGTYMGTAYFSNVPNTTNYSSAYSSAIEPGCQNVNNQGWRIGAGVVDNTLLMALPRTPFSEAASPYIDIVQYLNLECYPLNIGQNQTYPLIYGVNAGTSYNLDTAACNNAGGAAFFPRLETFGGAGALIFWLKIGGTNASISYCLPNITNNNGFSVNTGAVTVLPAMPANPPTSGCIDFTSASLNGAVYTFWANAGDQNIYVNPFVFNPQNAAAFTPGATTVFQTTPAGQTLTSLDASVVYIVENGVATTKIAVAAIWTANNQSTLTVWLYDPTAPQSSAASQLYVNNINARASAVRVVWGSIPDLSDDSFQALNGLTVMWSTPNSLDQYFANLGTPQLAVIDLSPENYGQIGPVVNVTPPMNLFPIAQGSEHWESNSDLASAICGNMAALTPSIVRATDGSDNAYYNILYIGLGYGSGVQGWLTPTPDSINNQITMFTAPYFSFKMEYQQGTPQPSTTNQTFNNYDLQAAISAWQLLGVVSGLPPLDVSSGGSSSISINYGISGGDSLTIQNGSTTTIGGKLSVLSSSVSDSCTKQNNSSTTVSVQQTVNYSVGYDGAAQNGASIGWLLFYQPQYGVNSYTAVGTAGSSGITMQILVQAGTGGIASFPFNMSAPNTPLSSDPVEALLTFPVQASGQPLIWPSTTDLPAWIGFLDQVNLNTVNINPEKPLQFLSVNASGTAVSTSLGVSNSGSTSLTSSQTISGSANCSAMKGILGFNIGGSITTSNTSQLNVGTTFNITVSYGAGALPTGYTVTPLLKQAGAPDTLWTPSIVGSQQPWLLTWEVTKD